VEQLDILLHRHGYPLLKSSGAVGAACVVVRAGSARGQRPPMVFTRGLGYECVEDGKVLDVNSSLFSCGNCSKVLCTLGIMQLWQEQGLNLHADVNDILPEGMELDTKTPITLHHLLTHTSGLAVPEGDDAQAQRRSLDTSALTAVEAIVQKSLIMERLKGLCLQQLAVPGTAHQLNATDDDLTGALLESYSGLEYSEYVQGRMMQPLELTMRANRTTMQYELDKTGDCVPSRTPLQPLQPTSGLLATPAEMAQILLWLVQPAGVGSTPGMLSEATIQTMLANHFPIGKTGQAACYGFTNVRVGSTGSLVPLIAHCGAQPGSCCQSLVAVMPELQCAIWLSSNTASQGLGFCLPMLELLMEELCPVEPPLEKLGAWVSGLTPGRSDTVLDLFCFPSAGCNASVQFEGWNDRLPNFISVKAVQLPGRGSRASEPPVKNLQDLADKAAQAIRLKLTDNVPVALFGHGMGGILAYEVACRLKGKYNRAPIHLLVAGCAAPSMWNTTDPLLGTKNNLFTPWAHVLVTLKHDPFRVTERPHGAHGGEGPPGGSLPQRAFLKQLDGCSRLPRHLKHVDQAGDNMVLTLLADITAEETYTPHYQGFHYPRHNPLQAAGPIDSLDDRLSTKLSCPVTVIRAKEDPYVPASFAERWAEVTSGAMKTHEIPGPHHSLEDSVAHVAVTEIVGDSLARQLTRHSAFLLAGGTRQ